MRAFLAAAMAVVVLATASECNLNSPGDKTPADAHDPGVVVLIEVTSNPSDIHVKVRIGARDHSGRPSVSLEGELYPTEHARRTTHKEFITHPASATVTYSVDALMAGQPGDLLGCKIIVNGVVPDSPDATHVAEVLEGMGSTQVWCTYTRYPVKV